MTPADESAHGATLPRRDDLTAEIAREEQRLAELHLEAEKSKARIAVLREQTVSSPCAAPRKPLQVNLHLKSEPTVSNADKVVLLPQ